MKHDLLNWFSAGLFASILTTSSASEGALVKKDLEYFLVGRPYVGYLVYDSAQKGPRPGLLVAHNWMGITDETKSKADQLAALGYVVLAVDIYGKNSRPTNAEEAGALSASFKKDRTMLRARMQQGLTTLAKQANVDSERIAVIGYCFGGTAAIELARAGAALRGVVSFHGGLDDPKPEDNKRIKARILALHGADDPLVPSTDVQAFENGMREAHIDWELVKYGNTVHSFTNKAAGSDNSKGSAYNAEADRRSWRSMQNFLSDVLK